MVLCLRLSLFDGLQKNKYVDLHVSLLNAGLNAWALSNAISSRTDRVPRPPAPPKEICARFLPSLMQLLSEVQLSQLSAALRQHRIDLQLQYGTAFNQLERSIFPSAASDSSSSAAAAAERPPEPPPTTSTKRKRKQAEETDTGSGSRPAVEESLADREPSVSGDEQRAVRVPDSYRAFVQRQPFGAFALLAHAMVLSQQIAWCTRSASDAAGASAPGQAASAAQMDRDEELRAHIQLLLALMARFEDAQQVDLCAQAAQQTASSASGSASASSPVLILEDVLLQSLVSDWLFLLQTDALFSFGGTSVVAEFFTLALKLLWVYAQTRTCTCQHLLYNTKVLCLHFLQLTSTVYSIKCRLCVQITCTVRTYLFVYGILYLICTAL